MIQVPVKRPVCVETTAMGAAYLAGLAVGYWHSKEEIMENWSVDQVFVRKLQKKSGIENQEAGRKPKMRLRLGKRGIENRKKMTPCLEKTMHIFYEAARNYREAVRQQENGVDEEVIHRPF